MKNAALKMFESMAIQVEAAVANPDAWLEVTNASPDSKYIQAFNKAIQSLGFSRDVAAKASLKVTLDVNIFDPDVCDVYVTRCFQPSLELVLTNKDKIEVYKDLSDTELLFVFCSKASLEYKD